MSELRVENLYTYPIKSCAGISLQYADVFERGLENDRYFMVTDSEGNFISQRTKPELALVEPDILDSDSHYIRMAVDAPNLGELMIDHEWHSGIPRELVRNYVHGKPVNGLRTADDADEWFSEYLNMPASLSAINTYDYRWINQRYYHEDATNAVAFADAFPFLLTSTASLDAFNRSMVEDLDAPAIPMNRFRPNVVVSGEGLEPYEEDYWRRVRIGQMVAYIVRPCKRCAIPYVDQDTAQSTGNKTVGRTLAATRRGRDTTKPDDDGKGVYFGQYLDHVYQEGLYISVDDEVVVLDGSKESNVQIR